jgi:hypothetical protein
MKRKIFKESFIARGVGGGDNYQQDYGRPRLPSNDGTGSPSKHPDSSYFNRSFPEDYFENEDEEEDLMFPDNVYEYEREKNPMKNRKLANESKTKLPSLKELFKDSDIDFEEDHGVQPRGSMKKDQEYKYDEVDLPKEKKRKEEKEKVSQSTYKTDVGEVEVGFLQDNGLEKVKKMIKEAVEKVLKAEDNEEEEDSVDEFNTTGNLGGGYVLPLGASNYGEPNLLPTDYHYAQGKSVYHKSGKKNRP